MKLRRNRRIRLVALTVFGFACPIHGQAELPQPLQQAGRLHGICWGDGYHACKDSGVRPLADLPPSTVRHSPVSHCAPLAPARRRAVTFYDRFDAANRCGGNPGNGCSDGCDSANFYVPGGEAVVPKATAMPVRTEPDRMIELPASAGPPRSEFVPPAPTTALDAPVNELPTPAAPTESRDPQPVAPIEPDPIEPLSSQPEPDESSSDGLPDLTAPLASEYQLPWAMPDRQAHRQRPYRPAPPVSSQQPLQLPAAGQVPPQPQITFPPVSTPVVARVQAAPATGSGKPVRLGGQTADDAGRQPPHVPGSSTPVALQLDPHATASRQFSARVNRLGMTPTRLGRATAEAVNPATPSGFLSRPVVEIAEQTVTSDATVVRQPTQLK